MAINGIVFDNQAPTAKGIRGGFASALSDGIVDGCDISYNGNIISMSPGILNVAGGLVSITGYENVSVTGTSGYARVSIVLDLSRTSTEQEFNQVYFEVDYSSSANGFNTLIKNDVNIGTGTIYKAELCVVSLGSSGVTGIVRKAIASAKLQYGDTLPSDAPEGTIFLLKIG